MSRLISPDMMDSLGAAAWTSPRGRQHLNLHASYDDPCQRLLNAVLPHSYIRPHRHACDPKQETLIALRGTFGAFIFDDEGEVVLAARLGEGSATSAIEVDPGEWHTVVALSEDAVLLETKGGPFDPNAAKEPAHWAPEEGADAAAAYLAGLKAILEAESA